MSHGPLFSRSKCFGNASTVIQNDFFLFRSQFLFSDVLCDAYQIQNVNDAVAVEVWRTFPKA